MKARTKGLFQRPTTNKNGPFFLQIVFILLLAIYLLSTVQALGKAGITWDDEIEIIGLYDHITFAKDWIKTFGAFKDYQTAISTNLEYYGIINKIAGLIVFRAIQAIPGIPPEVSDEILGPIAINKIFSVFLFLGTLFLCLKILTLLRRSWGLLGVCLILAFPVLTGHSWINIKDVPFAFFYTLFTYTIVRHVATDDKAVKRGARELVRSNYKEGLIWPVVTCSLVIACRPAFALFGLLSLWSAIALKKFWIQQTSSLPKQDSKIEAVTEVVISSIGTIFLATVLIPPAWPNPFLYFFNAASFHSMHPWGGCMLLFGECKSIGQEYRTLNYLVEWLIVKTPLLHIFLTTLILLYFIISFTRSAFRGRNQLRCFHNRIDHSIDSCNENRKIYSGLILIAFQGALLPAAAILRNSITYDGLRHWLFSITAFCVLISYALEAIWRNEGSRLGPGISLTLRLAGMIIVTAGLIGPSIDTLALAPYSYVYTNSLFRSRLDHESMDLDYWGISSREIVEQIRSRDWKVSNIEDNGSGEHVMYQRLYTIEGRFPAIKNTPETALVHKRFKDQSLRLKGHQCKEKFFVNRNYPTGRRLLIAAVGLDCKKLPSPGGQR